MKTRQRPVPHHRLQRCSRACGSGPCGSPRPPAVGHSWACLCPALLRPSPPHSVLSNPQRAPQTPPRCPLQGTQPILCGQSGDVSSRQYLLRRCVFSNKPFHFQPLCEHVSVFLSRFHRLLAGPSLFKQSVHYSCRHAQAARLSCLAAPSRLRRGRPCFSLPFVRLCKRL